MSSWDHNKHISFTNQTCLTCAWRDWKLRFHTFYGEFGTACAPLPDELWAFGSPLGMLWSWFEYLEWIESCSMIMHNTFCNSGQRSWKWWLEVFWMMEMCLDLLYMMLIWGLCDWFAKILQGEGVLSLRLKMLKEGEMERMRRKLALERLWCNLWRGLDLYL